MLSNEETFYYWCALYYTGGLYAFTFIFLLIMIAWTTRYLQYKTTKATILSIVAETTPLPLLTTQTPAPIKKKKDVSIKQYQITYTEDQKTYTIVVDDWRVHQVGDEINIRIRRTDPTKYSVYDDTMFFLFIWVVMMVVILITKVIYNTVNTPGGSRLICIGSTMRKLLKKH